MQTDHCLDLFCEEHLENPQSFHQLTSVDENLVHSPCLGGEIVPTEGYTTA